MGTYIIKVKNTSGTEGTVIANAGFSYSDKLNSHNDGQLKISGTGEVKRSLFEIGSEVYIYRNGTLEFHGIINAISFLDAGGIAADLLGNEVWLTKENGDYGSSPYENTASATIAGHIIGESTKFSQGTIEAGENLDFRIEKTSSLWNALSSLIKRTAQDIGIDYANAEVDILDHKGSSTSVATLNDGVQIQDLTVRQSYPIANDVRVYGQGEGNTRIKSDTGQGQDATSKSTYGTIRKVYNDPSVTTVNEANTLANKLVAKWKDPVKIYEFDVINPTKNLVAGDVVTLNSSTKGLSDEEVRIVSMERGVRNSQEFLTLQVTNKAYSTIERGIDQILAELEKKANDLQTYDQYNSEYANQNEITCVGGIGQIGTGACGCSGGWMYLDGSLSLPSGVIQAAVLNINASSIYNYIAGSLIVTGNIDASSAPTLGCHLTNKTYVDNCVGAGGSSVWADGTNPYIYPCNSCGLCMFNDIIDGTSGNCLGIPQSPGAWKEVHALCMDSVYFVCTPAICNSGGISMCNSSGKVAEFGTSCTCLATIRTKDIHAFSNGSCSVGISSCRFGTGYINCMYTCRRLKLPVGTNCY